MYTGIFRTDPAPQRQLPSAILPAAGFTQPTPQGPLSVAMMVGIALAWPQTSDAPLTQPQYDRRNVVIATLPTGQQPPIAGPLEPEEFTIIRGWWPESSDIAQVQQGFRSVVPALPNVSQPPRLGEQIQVVINWSWLPPEYISISMVGAAAFLPPAGDQPAPYSPLPRQILDAWQPPYIKPPEQKQITEPSVDRPPRYVLAQQDVVTAWQPPYIWPPKPVQLTPVTPGNNPPTTSIVNIEEIIYAWVPPFIMPQRLVQVAPLTIRYGNQPPINNNYGQQIILLSWVYQTPFNQQYAVNGFQAGVAPTATAIDQLNLAWL